MFSTFFLFLSVVKASRCLNDGYDIAHDLCIFKDYSSCPVERYEEHNCTSNSEMKYIKSWIQTQYNIDDSDVSFQQHVAQALRNEDRPWLPNVALAPKSGMCMAYIPRFAYDVKTHSCNWFVYGGCDGNANNFETIEMCTQMGYLWVLQYDNETSKCKSDGYSIDTKGFCTFLDNTKCEMKAYLSGTCVSASEKALVASWLKVIYSGFDMLSCGDREALILETIKDSRKPWVHVLKSLKPQPGPCEAYIRSYYYDSEADACKPFIYGGCQGNANRFSNKISCVQIAHLYRQHKN